MYVLIYMLYLNNVYICRCIVDIMINKELKLIESLLEIVNSDEEFNILLQDKRILQNEQMKGGTRKW